MPHCKQCNYNYKGLETIHERSKIHLTNEREWYKKHYHNHSLRKDLEIQDNIDIQANYLTIEEDFLDTMTEEEHTCGNYKICGYVTDDFNTCLDHEAECYNMPRPIISFDTVISNDSVTCEDCGHIFIKSTKGNKPHHILKRHKTSGRCIRKQMRTLLPLLKHIDTQEDIDKLKAILQN